ncbi:hypothetical protein G4B88_021117 [Cannabis sativa]|uniref:Uncharacterized protein n=1 Tax=Cannabis sativa TaxID=3483 RepID=A0A7J6HX88_CANSA|nr:hypothetical protein G4B88_021117 [Cannabis sativa]
MSSIASESFGDGPGKEAHLDHNLERKEEWRRLGLGLVPGHRGYVHLDKRARLRLDMVLGSPEWVTQFHKAGIKTNDKEVRERAMKSWDSICKPKSYRGLGIGRFVDINFCLLAKLWWMLLKGGDALWIKVLLNKYCVGSSYWQSSLPHHALAIAKGI